jgi:hypothetical protein
MFENLNPIGFNWKCVGEKSFSDKKWKGSGNQGALIVI